MRPDHPAWLAHDRSGRGTPLVLIHGLGSHRAVWRPVFAAAAAHRDVIALDLPGFGASPPWPDPTPATDPPPGHPATRSLDRTFGPVPGSVPHLADRVAEFLAGLGVSRPHLAGSSLGGGVALELSRRGLARSVTAFAPVGFWRQPGLRWCQLVLGAARTTGAALHPALPRLLAGSAGRAALCGMFYARPSRLPPGDAVAAAAALTAAPGFEAARAALDRWIAPGARDPALATTPVTIAWGTRDLVLPYRSQARRARAALPAARHVALRGCGHLPFADDPVACAELLTERQ